jgi:hypothetical protein
MAVGVIQAQLGPRIIQPSNRCCRTSRARIATRYDKLAANYLAFVKPAAIRIWLRAYEPTPLIHLAHETGKLVNIARRAYSFLRATAMPEIAVPFPFRCATARTVHPADAIAIYRRRSAGHAGAL